MNDIEPKPDESGKEFSYWRHPDSDWYDAIEVVDCADDGWGVWFWQIVSSVGVTKGPDGKGPLYDWSPRVYFSTREEAEHYAQLVWDMKLYD